MVRNRINKSDRLAKFLTTDTNVINQRKWRSVLNSLKGERAKEILLLKVEIISRAIEDTPTLSDYEKSQKNRELRRLLVYGPAYRLNRLYNDN